MVVLSKQGILKHAHTLQHSTWTHKASLQVPAPTVVEKADNDSSGKVGHQDG